MTVSPDFRPAQIAEWYIFNTWLQKQLDIPIHLELFDNFESQRKAIDEGKIDLIFANPFDASMLVREKSFVAIAKPEGHSDEALIAVSVDSEVQDVTDLKPGIRIAKTDDPEVNMIGMIMLEPADLNAENTSSKVVDTYALVAKQVMMGESAVGFFLAEAFENFSGLISNQLKVLVRSQISVISHAFMVSPNAAEHMGAMQAALVCMADDPKTQDVLAGMGFSGWEKQSYEDTEFMIDLMDTLVD
jgi:phosphonate transport system substrate-binding protein